jgi:hypothetical protein
MMSLDVVLDYYLNRVVGYMNSYILLTKKSLGHMISSLRTEHVIEKKKGYEYSRGKSDEKTKNT